MLNTESNYVVKKMLDVRRIFLAKDSSRNIISGVGV